VANAGGEMDRNDRLQIGIDMRRPANDVLDIIRKIKGLKSDKDLGKLFGVSQSTVASWRARDTLSYTDVINLCLKEEISLDFIFSKKQKRVKGDGWGQSLDPNIREMLAIMLLIPDPANEDLLKQARKEMLLANIWKSDNNTHEATESDIIEAVLDRVKRDNVINLPAYFKFLSDPRWSVMDDTPGADSTFVIFMRMIVIAEQSEAGGRLMITDKIPMDANSLAAIVRRPPLHVNLALASLSKLHFIEIDDESIIILDWDSENEHAE
jgi:hypothetical protein